MDKKILTIGYLTPSFFNGIRLSQYQGVLDGAREYNINFLCFSGSSTIDPFESNIQDNRVFELVNSKIVDGLICWTQGLFKPNPFLDIDKLLGKNKNIPIVCLGKSVRDFPSVMGDDSLGIIQLMTHLIEVHKYRKIAFIKGPEAHGNTSKRYNGYLELMKKYGIPVDEKLISPFGNFDQATGRKGIEYFFDVMKLKPKIDVEAIVTVSDLISIGAVKEMQKRGIKVPRDVAVVGFNNKEEGLEITPQLTSIDLQFAETGKTAIRTLMSILNKEKVPDLIYTPSKLVIRESCGCLHSAFFNEQNVSCRDISLISGDADIDKDGKIRNKFIDELTRFILTFPEALYDAKWTPVFINSFFDDLLLNRENQFIDTLINIFEDVLKNNYNIQIWQNIITKIHSLILTLENCNLILKAENILHNARVLIFQKLEQSITINRLKFYRQQEIFPVISSAIVTTFDVKTLMEIIEKELPRLGISACYLSLYTDQKNPNDRARLIMAFDENGHIDLDKIECVFQSNELLPRGIFPVERKFEFVVKPLFFQEAPLGFILFKLENIDTTIYFTLRTYISSALQGAMLVKGIEERAEELENAYKILKENQQKLIISEKMASIGRLTASIAHEMNTPLAAVRSALKELDYFIEEYYKSIDNPRVLPEDHKAITADMRKHLTIAIKSVEKSVGFIRGIKAQTYFNSEKNLHSFNASEVAADNLNLLEHLFLKNKCNLANQIDKEVMLYGDPRAFSQILSNLIINSIDACGPDGGQVTVNLKKLDVKKVQLAVTDTGAGIPKENVSKIFDPFFTTKPFGDGAGLGLSIVHDLVKEFNGNIEVQSRPENTVFTIIFPVNKHNIKN